MTDCRRVSGAPSEPRRMQPGTDYHKNLEVVDRFPWSLYHRPIRQAVLDALSACGPAPLKLLNVGCGLSQIYPHLPPQHSYTGVDVDERAVRTSQERFGPSGATFVACEPLSLPFPDQSFDFVFATEVVEHVLEPEVWLAELVRVTRPGGLVQLSTPDYGQITLPLIEKTFLELVARSKGFSRAGIHPTKFSRGKLRRLMEEFLGEVTIGRTPGWLALIGTGRKPS